MKRLFVYSAIAVLGLSWVVGCSDDTTTKKTESTTSPTGSKSSTTTEKTSKSGKTPSDTP
ncbi:MAG TPA: hypothetical protein VMR25_06075 [Planctomycetaceae bacterium]|jgi:hypothetical protein|nr:hypothetical protein [Planctomycetaceae bacterium]